MSEYDDDICHYSLRTTVAPTAEPVSLSEARAQCAMDATEYDDMLTGWIKAARELVEVDTCYPLMNQTKVMTLDRMPCGEIQIPLGNVTAVSSIVYLDMAGNSTTWSSASYVADVYSSPVRIRPKFGQMWPVALPQLNSVSVTFTCGHASSSDVPQVAKQAILLLVAEWWKNREDSTAQKTSDATQLAYNRLVQRLKQGFYP